VKRKNPLVMAERTTATLGSKDCCCSSSHGGKTCKGNEDVYDSNHKMSSSTSRSLSSVSPSSTLIQFLRNVKALYAAALGIEILCIAAAEIGENTGLYILGFNHIGLPIAYAMGYGLASFTTFATILGRYKYGCGDNKIDSCCSSVLEQGNDNKSRGFFSNLIITFKNFGLGLKKMRDLPNQPNLKEIMKASILILITAETACIVTAETVDLIFYKQAIYLSIPLALLAGAFSVVAPEAYRMTINQHKKT
jgi:hypothetical protein